MTFMPTFKMSATDPSEAMLLLRTLCRDGLLDQLEDYDDPATNSRYQSRLDAELDIIQRKNFSNYFLIVADYVQWARANEIAVGPGRGSGPCSLVAYVLKITLVDPIKYDLPFERFVNLEKDSLPDFDIDFGDDRCDEVVQYLQNRYGRERLAQINSPDNTPLSSRLVIGDRSLTELVPLYTHPKENILTTKLTISDVADAGLVRFNVIGNKTLTFIQRVIRQIQLSGTEFDINRIPLDDGTTMRTLRTEDSIALNCYDKLPGGEHYASTFKLLKPDNFATLCAAIALSFPALQNRALSYTQPAQRIDAIEAFFPAYRTITRETRGHLLYQEQLMDVALQVSGLSNSQGDLFRRALRQSTHPALPNYHRRFTSGAIERGYSELEAEAIYQHIAKFGGGYFNKSHAVAYGMLVYQMAWLQTYFPKEWSSVTSK